MDPFTKSIISRRTFEPNLTKLSEDMKEFVDAIDRDSVIMLCAKGVTTQDISGKDIFIHFASHTSLVVVQYQLFYIDMYV